MRSLLVRTFVRAFSLSSRIIAGKRADPIRDERLSAALPRPCRIAPAHQITPVKASGEAAELLALDATAVPAETGIERSRALGERLGNRNKPVPSAFYQDANYHDQIVKEQNKPTAQCTIGSRPSPRRHPSLGNAMDRGSVRKAGPGLNP
jgi:hypothetical protein